MEASGEQSTWNPQRELVAETGAPRPLCAPHPSRLDSDLLPGSEHMTWATAWHTVSTLLGRE